MEARLQALESEWGGNASFLDLGSKIERKMVLIMEVKPRVTLFFSLLLRWVLFAGPNLRALIVPFRVIGWMNICLCFSGESHCNYLLLLDINPYTSGGLNGESVQLLLDGNSMAWFPAVTVVCPSARNTT